VQTFGVPVDTAEIRWPSFPMTIILILTVALVAGAIMRSRWALLIPLALGIVAAIAVAATGHGLGDTPIPFLVVVSTLAIGGGQGLQHGRRA
jgi:hypothetical protein